MVRKALRAAVLAACAALAVGIAACTPSTERVLTNPGEGPKTPAKNPAPAGEVVPGAALRVPFILWGGDMATFYGNGGLKTTRGSVFANKGLVLDLVDGNDFDAQLADYEAGRSPFLRGTFRMIGLAAERLAKDPGAQPMVFMQMTWSAGDHLVGRAEVKTIADLKGKTIAIQQNGPHIGMLDDVLSSAKLDWDDVKVKWADNITGPGSPAAMFQQDSAVDAAFAVTPDMLGITGGLELTGTGAEGTVKGARVVVSTAELSHSIADVYAVRKDWYQDNKQTVEKFTSGYLKSVEEVIAHKRTFEASGSDVYMRLLQQSQDIFGADVLPTLEEDAHGLLSDCAFVGHAGNVAFFDDPKNPHGFADFNRRSQALAVSRGYASTATPVMGSPLDWTSPTVIEGLTRTDVSRGQRFDAEALLTEVEGMDADGVLDSRTLLSFTVAFEPNQTVFDSKDYKEEFDRLFGLAARYGNAAVVIRGHSDTTLVLRDAVKAGLENGKLKRSGSKGSYRYFLDGRPLDIEDQKQMAELIRTSDAFRPVNGIDARRTMQAALNLSRERAQAVRTSIIEYGLEKGLRIDESQIQAQGVGIREPLVARPRNPDEAAVNMRVEFRLVRVSAEAMTDADFDF